MKYIFSIVCIAIVFYGYSIFRSAAISILNGNCSKTRANKIKKETTFIDRLKLSYILPYANQYKNELNQIIFFSRVYLVLIAIEFILFFTLLLLNQAIEIWLIILAVNIVLVLPAFLFELLHTYFGWNKNQRKGWKFEIDGKEKRRNKTK